MENFCAHNHIALTAPTGDLQSQYPRLVAPSPVGGSGKEAGSVGAGDKTRQGAAWLCPDWRPLACLCSSCSHELAQKVGRLSKVISKVRASLSRVYLSTQNHSYMSTLTGTPLDKIDTEETKKCTPSLTCSSERQGGPDATVLLG